MTKEGWIRLQHGELSWVHDRHDGINPHKCPSSCGQEGADCPIMIAGYPKTHYPIGAVGAALSALGTGLRSAKCHDLPVIGLFVSQAGSAPLKRRRRSMARLSPGERAGRVARPPRPLRSPLPETSVQPEYRTGPTRVGAAHFRKEDGTRTLIQPSARISAVPIERAYGLAYCRIITIPVTDVVHSTPLTYPWMPST
jgi:hypothetical protein